jgi:hypothetical protein
MRVQHSYTQNDVTTVNNYILRKFLQEKAVEAIKEREDKRENLSPRNRKA